MYKNMNGSRSCKLHYRHSSSILITALLGIAISGAVARQLLATPSTQSTETVAHASPIGIIIMAQGRSGSTMLGETFRQNKDVLYWYEPCRAWGQGLFDSSQHYHKEIHGWECSELVRSEDGRNTSSGGGSFEDGREVVNPYPRADGNPAKHHQRRADRPTWRAMLRLARCDFTLYDSARLAVDPTALGSGSPRLEPLRAAFATQSSEVLAQAHTAVLAECRKSRAVVVKTIRADTGVGGPNGDASGLLVVHLVRDPRAVIHSQIKTFNVAHKYRRYFSGPIGLRSDNVAGGNTTENTAGGGGDRLSALPGYGRDRAHALGLIVCGVYRDQLDSSAKLGDGRYLRMRYEDIASSADLAVARVYHWSGLGAVPSRVSMWVHENTRLLDCGNDLDTTATTATTALPNPLNNAAVAPTRETHRSISTVPSTRGLRGYARPGNQMSLAMANTEVLAAIDTARRVFSGNDADGGPGEGDGGDGQKQGNADREGHLRCGERMAKQTEWDKYGTRRHSAAMVGLWRKQMTEEDSVAVWEACADSGVMETMEYTL